MSQTQPQRTTVRFGPGFGVLLFLVFLVLKLIDKIDWSWWWVTAPLWIPAALGLVVAIVGGIVVLFTALASDSNDRRNRRAK